MKFYIIGSALSQEEPRDIDMCGVMEDRLFKAVFGLTSEEFSNEHWRSEQTRVRVENLGAIRVLQYVFPQLVPLDFKFIPESLLHEPYKEVDIATSPDTWGIGLPNLESQGKNWPEEEVLYILEDKVNASD